MRLDEYLSKSSITIHQREETKINWEQILYYNPQMDVFNLIINLKDQARLVDSIKYIYNSKSTAEITFHLLAASIGYPDLKDKYLVAMMKNGNKTTKPTFRIIKSLEDLNYEIRDYNVKYEDVIDWRSFISYIKNKR